MKKSWPKKSLSDISEKIDYGVTASANDEAVGPKFLRITDIKDGQVNWEKVPFCECERNEQARKELFSGDIVFARTGTTGKSFLIFDPPKNAVFASYLIRITPAKVVDPSYLFHYFQTRDYWNQISKGSRGAVTQGVNASVLGALQIPLPPLSEQRRIAGSLNRINLLRQKHIEAQRFARNLVPAVFEEMFGKQLLSSRKTKEITLGDMGEIITGNTPPRDNVENYGDFIEWVKTDNINETQGTVEESLERLSETGAQKGRIVPANSVLVTCIAGSIGHIGNAALTNREVAINQQINAIVPRQGVEGEFLLALIYSLKLTIQANATGVMTRLLNKSRLAMIPAINPPEAMQKEFSKAVKNLRAFDQMQIARGQMIGALEASLAEEAFK